MYLLQLLYHLWYISVRQLFPVHLQAEYHCGVSIHKKEPHLTLLKSETCFQHDIILQNRKCITCADVRVLNRWIPLFV